MLTYSFRCDAACPIMHCIMTQGGFMQRRCVMASVTLSARKDYAVGSVPAIPAVPKKRFLARLYDAIVAA